MVLGLLFLFYPIWGSSYPSTICEKIAVSPLLCRATRVINQVSLFAGFTLGPSVLLFVHLCAVAQTVKRLSTMRETQVQALGWEDPLEKEMIVHSSTSAWKIPWTEEPGRLQSMGSQRVGHD